MSEIENQRPSHLAWHETLELHELVGAQSFALMKLKKFIGDIKDAELRKLYVHTIEGIEKNLEELLQFYTLAPREEEEAERNLDTVTFSGDLLVFAKTAVRNYAIAITETATPVLRETLQKQLLRAIKTHGMVYAFMYERGLYPSYDLRRLLQNDMKLANEALKLDY